MAETIYYRATQIRNALHHSEIKIGTRLAILSNDQEFASKQVPEPIFRTGTVSRFYGNESDPIMVIVFDDPNPSVELHCGRKEYSRLCVRAPERIPVRRRDAAIRLITLED